MSGRAFSPSTLSWIRKPKPLAWSWIRPLKKPRFSGRVSRPFLVFTTWPVISMLLMIRISSVNSFPSRFNSDASSSMVGDFFPCRSFRMSSIFISSISCTSSFFLYHYTQGSHCLRIRHENFNCWLHLCCFFKLKSPRNPSSSSRWRRPEQATQKKHRRLTLSAFSE
ncbi:hypothetical protein SDC9_163267 [bioreactor metagenome]|uniref:Uncharacterized protein n=1 Tax=bioreactor metagenome TaxID=1076179 RepID=A0A645FNE6_9ZZZZ